MVYEVLHNVVCWRCKVSNTFLFEAEGYVLAGPRISAFLCFDCLEDLVDIRIEFEASRRRGRGRHLEEEDVVCKLMVESIVLRRLGVADEVLRFDTASLQAWLPGAMVMPCCAFCGSDRAFNVYEFGDDPFPIFTLCKTCIRQLVVANTNAGERGRLFEYVQFVRCRSQLKRLDWGSAQLVAFLAADSQWAEAMKPWPFDF